MLVVVEQLHAQLHIKKTAASELQGRPAGIIERRAGLPEAAIRAELVRMLVGDLLEGLGADFLFALDEVAERDWDFAKSLHGLERVDPRHHVGLVVGDSASDAPSV